MDKFTVACLLVSVVGLVLIFLSVQTIEPKQTKIIEIDSDMVGTEVSITGTVKSSYTKNEHVFLTVSDNTGAISVVIFSDVASKLTTKDFKGKSISVSGIVDEYNSKLEIVPRKPSDITLLG